MSLIDFILNIAGLLLWLNWRAVRPPAAAAAAGSGGVAALPRAEAPRARWRYLLALAALLLGRAVFYWQAGGPLKWDPGIRLNGMVLPFYSDWLGRMVLFSLFSFGATLGFFYLCLLLLSSVNGRAADADPAQQMVRLHLGRLERWPGGVKLLLPLLVMTALWCALNPLLLWRMEMVPRVSTWHLLAQGAVIGLAVYFALRFLVVGFLALYVVNSYVYLGDFAFLNFVNTTARGLLRPLRRLPLRVGRVDLAPLAGMALVLLAAELGRRGLARLQP
ncbi:MAG: hypothetical protein ABSG04_06065 [Verrucomicrobiota bacterium]|jgi:uncharacterized protein YggT (Ycf19 family)